MSCPSKSECEIYSKLPGAFPELRDRYCEADLRFIECERRMRGAAGGCVPEGLLPDGRRIDT